MILFPANIDTYLEKSSTNTLAQYISTNREAILHSVKQAQKKATENTKPLEHWFKPTEPLRMYFFLFEIKLNRFQNLNR